MKFRQRLLDQLDLNNGSLLDSDLCCFSEELYNSRQLLPRMFRYMPASYYNIRGLETDTLFLAETGKMNDIFEGLSTFIDSNTRDNLDKTFDLMYMKSFSESFDNLRMWGLYADNYAGICVEYDLRDMNMHTDYYWHLYPVIYKEERYDTVGVHYFTIDDLNNYKHNRQICDAGFLSDVNSLFLVKSQNWEYEQEWRILVPYLYMHERWHEGGVLSNDEDERMYSINSQTIDFPYVSKVYMGPRIPEMQKEHLIEICRKKQIEIYMTKPSLKKYSLEYTKIQ